MAKYAINKLKIHYKLFPSDRILSDFAHDFLSTEVKYANMINKTFNF